MITFSNGEVNRVALKKRVGPHGYTNTQQSVERSILVKYCIVGQEYSNLGSTRDRATGHDQANSPQRHQQPRLPVQQVE